MYDYKVTITETLSRTVNIKAKNSKEAKCKVKSDYSSGKYVLDADDFNGVSFKVEKRNLTKE